MHATCEHATCEQMCTTCGMHVHDICMTCACMCIYAVPRTTKPNDIMDSFEK